MAAIIPVYTPDLTAMAGQTIAVANNPYQISLSSGEFFTIPSLIVQQGNQSAWPSAITTSEIATASIPFPLTDLLAEYGRVTVLFMATGVEYTGDVYFGMPTGYMQTINCNAGVIRVLTASITQTINGSSTGPSISGVAAATYEGTVAEIVFEIVSEGNVLVKAALGGALAWTTTVPISAFVDTTIALGPLGPNRPANPDVQIVGLLPYIFAGGTPNKSLARFMFSKTDTITAGTSQSWVANEGTLVNAVDKSTYDSADSYIEASSGSITYTLSENRPETNGAVIGVQVAVSGVSDVPLTATLGTNSTPIMLDAESITPVRTALANAEHIDAITIEISS